MAATFGFHPEALFEYAEASKYYLDAASPRVAEAFVTAVESAVSSLVANPLRWRVVESPRNPEIRLHQVPLRAVLQVGVIT